MLGIGLHAVQRKARKIARQCEWLHGNLSFDMRFGSSFALDEEETYEAASIRRVTIAMLIEREHWFVVGCAVGSIRRLSKPGTARRRWQDFDEARNGRRKDESSACVRSVLGLLRSKVGSRQIALVTDQKSSYRRIARQMFGGLVSHETVSGCAPRTPSNALFSINTMQAITRDLVGSLRRQSWHFAKKKEQLALRLAIFVMYRNYVRKRFNTDREEKASAVYLGLIPRSLTFDEAMRWRQDWGAASPHPLSRDGRWAIGGLEAICA